MKFSDLLAKIEMKLRPSQLGSGLGKLDDADGVTAIDRANEAENPPPDWVPADPEEEK